MATRWLWGAAALFTVVTMLFSVARTRWTPGPAWGADYAEALQAARSAGKPVILCFTAEWCSWCARMERGAWADADVRRLARRYVAVRIDIDRHPDLARRYRVDAVPATVLLSPAGSTLVEVRGYAEAEGLARALSDGLARTR